MSNGAIYRQLLTHLHDRFQLGRSVVIGGDPRGKLGMPDQGMAAHLLPVLASKSKKLVAQSEVENAWLGLDDLPITRAFVNNGFGNVVQKLLTT